MVMPKQRSEKYIEMEHPLHGKKNVLAWVAPHARKLGWKYVDKKTETKKQEVITHGKDNR